MESVFKGPELWKSDGVMFLKFIESYRDRFRQWIQMIHLKNKGSNGYKDFEKLREGKVVPFYEDDIEKMYNFVFSDMMKVVFTQTRKDLKTIITMNKILLNTGKISKITDIPTRCNNCNSLFTNEEVKIIIDKGSIECKYCNQVSIGESKIDDTQVIGISIDIDNGRRFDITNSDRQDYARFKQFVKLCRNKTLMVDESKFKIVKRNYDSWDDIYHEDNIII